MSKEYGRFSSFHKSSLTVVRGGARRKSAPRAHRGINGALRAPEWLRDVERAWLTDLRALEIPAIRLPFPFFDTARVLWLPDSQQALLLAINDFMPVPEIARELHAQIGSHPLADTPDDLRVIKATEGGWFSGFRPDGRLHDMTDLHRCVSCSGWWFATEEGAFSSRCRVCGHDDEIRSHTIGATITNEVPRLWRGRAA
jgi:hypothetical protein